MHEIEELLSPGKYTDMVRVHFKLSSKDAAILSAAFCAREYYCKRPTYSRERECSKKVKKAYTEIADMIEECKKIFHEPRLLN